MISPTSPAGLPEPDAAARAHSDTLARHLAERIQTQPDGFLSFESWMADALYAPGLGYYAAGSLKFGSGLPEGDFTTAAELTPLFGRSVARQVLQILQASDSTTILEFGAGTGALAAAIIPALREAGLEPRYQILEVSADLRARQQSRLAPLNAQVEWLEHLPASFAGCVLANEVLDAMPATLFQWSDDGDLLEVGVRLDEDNSQRGSRFKLATRMAAPALAEIVSQRMPALPGYQSEINLQAEAWISGMGEWLTRGAALLFDYGFPQREYYHPQRAEGTLMCHYRHHAHAQPLIYPGLQDITAHVDFTAMADAALAGGLDVLGYTAQARFLLNVGLPELLMGGDVGPKDMSSTQKLLSEAEMGELFKVLAIGRDIDGPLLGFTRGDRRDRL